SRVPLGRCTLIPTSRRRPVLTRIGRWAARCRRRMMPRLGGMLTPNRHYVRTLGPDGGVEVCDGPAIGLDLASMLEPGLPPWNVALQIFAGLCEILDIADQDGQVHGDLGLRDVFVDDTGAVSVEGLGQA